MKCSVFKFLQLCRKLRQNRGLFGPSILPYQKPTFKLSNLIHWVQKRSDRARFFKANFDGFWQFSQKVLKIQKLYIPHLKALIYSYYEPEGQGVWCLHMTARVLGMKLKLFSLKGVWQICLEGHALYHWGSKELHIRAFQ